MECSPLLGGLVRLFRLEPAQAIILLAFAALPTAPTACVLDWSARPA